MPFSFLEFMSAQMAPEPYPGTAQPNFDPPALTPLRKPIAESRIGLFTSAGMQLPSEPRLAETNDLSFRLVKRNVPLADLIVAHMTPVRKWALEDPNVAFPRDRLIELEREGVIGALADDAVSMVGSISRYTELLTETVPRIKEEFDRQQVDLVLLTPF